MGCGGSNCRDANCIEVKVDGLTEGLNWQLISQDRESSALWQRGSFVPDRCERRHSPANPVEPKPQNEHMLHGGGQGNQWCGHTGRCALTEESQSKVCDKGVF